MKRAAIEVVLMSLGAAVVVWVALMIASFVVP